MAECTEGQEASLINKKDDQLGGDMGLVINTI
jgi:hypothetical protein